MVKRIALLLNIILLVSLSAAAENTVLSSDLGGWRADVNEFGAITCYSYQKQSENAIVYWHLNQYAGPSWEGVRLIRDGRGLKYSGWRRNLKYSIEYKDNNGRLEVIASIENHNDSIYKVQDCERLILGIDHSMSDTGTLQHKFFPTMLRCEKTHFWSYFQNPNGDILSVSSPDAVASWSLGYIGNGHNIATSYLDLMHCQPLPARHPEGLDQLGPGEHRTWRLFLQPLGSLEDVLNASSHNCEAPIMGIDRTTVAPGEQFTVSVYGKDFFEQLEITDAAGKSVTPVFLQEKEGILQYGITAPGAFGHLKIMAVGNGHRTEAVVYIRKPWGWYLQQARDEALRMQVKVQSHREGWMGLITAYLAESYFPDKGKMQKAEKEFARFLSLMTDSTGGFKRIPQTWSSRPQNTSWMIDLMNARYAASGSTDDLLSASEWADRLITDFQKPDGAFQGYTALTMGAKFLQDLIVYEYPLSLTDTVWQKRFERHSRSIEKAARSILGQRDMGETEGEATYEDNQAGSAWSLLAMHALNSPTEEKADYLKASLEVQKRHECLTQALVPDGRMRGGTLRFWEAQYDILTPPNMMNSPHGWSMRSQFGALYLYLLTGNAYFLDVAYNAMGSCIQAIDESTGELRWAFVPDPYVEAQLFVEDPEHAGRGMREPKVIGEQWLPMISSWWKIPEGEIGTLSIHNECDGFQEPSQGWSCDNDVHFHFITLADEFLPNAFVVEMEDGTFKTYNCSLSLKGSTLLVTPYEKVVSRVHFNLKKKYRVKVKFATQTTDNKLGVGMKWVSSTPERMAHSYLNNSGFASEKRRQ